jgi:hypothetical protein
MAVAQKRGMVVYVCDSPVNGSTPDYATRRKIERQVSKSVLEHLIIYVDKDKTNQIWQWVKREQGKPVACREHTYHRTQPGDPLIQKLQAIAFSLAEEESLSLVDVTRRTRKAFDVERVTKRFYDEFRKQHAAFLKFISGIPVKEDQEWYASVMLNRLMFIYFIQRKGFLDGHHDYLRNRLIRTKQEFGKDKFYSFYRYFLLRLFHEGLGGRERTPDLKKLLGRIPYLNGGLFDIHELERPDRYGKAIQIPDKAFEAIFDYFDGWQWHLDERPLRAGDEINPGVLGYIFEKYINQKQMGAYYTEEDITEYISKNTVIPFLFDAARPKCRIAFDNPNGPTIWDLLKADPERYIYPALLHGKDKPLPANVAAGLNDVFQRGTWNKPAPAEFALPTEIWREVVARRKRCEELLAKLAGGEVRDINDLITLNLNIRQFAQDVIENCEGPELLRAFWHAIEHVTILDTTAGSGAFLFAALNVLEPLYEACLDRMEAFVEDLDRSGEKHRPEKFSDFRKVLENVAAHPNRRYFIFKSIILNNLFGVDIMEEAVEICKLRLFLKLAAQVEPDAANDNFGIEPLPDIDFNIRAGNTLVGYATADEVRRAFKEGPGRQAKLLLGDSPEAYQRFEEQVELADRAFNQFHEMQTEHGMDAKEFVNAKQTLRERLKALGEELNRYLSGEYTVKASDKTAYKKWLKSHQPFHWFVEFYGIVSNGGFDVIIGNPPYVEYKNVKGIYTVREFETLPCGDLYAYCTERALSLLKTKGQLGLIVPISSFGTDGFESLQKLALGRLDPLWVSFFANRPSQLFNGAQKRLTILIGRRSAAKVPTIFTTSYFRWKKEEFDHLFRTRVHYAPPHPNFSVFPASLEKLGNGLEVAAFRRLTAVRDTLAGALSKPTRHRVYYTRKFGYFLAFLDFIPKIIEIKTGRRVPPSELKELAFQTTESVQTVVAALSSSTFFWFWNVLSDCRNLNRRDILAFTVAPKKLPQALEQELASIGKRYLDELKKSSRTMLKSGLKIETFEYAESKPILDEIDRVLAAHYGFKDEELDFIINYDIKYRMGRDAENTEDSLND